MSRSLRVFVSSTMKDLANERDAVCRQLRAFNFEPVNAEAWLPSGTEAWARICEEIESSHVFLLLLGDRYGWIPAEGPMANANLSVTHLEFREACRLGLPILPFLKDLDYDIDRQSEEARQRDLFREEVSKWAGGTVVSRFKLAHDLEGVAAQSVVRLLTNDFLKQKISARAISANRSATLLERRLQLLSVGQSPPIPAELFEAVRTGKAILFAGAGISLSAGLPSAAALSAHLEQVFFPGVATGLSSRMSFAQLAGAVAETHSHAALRREIQKLLSPPQGLEPSSSHVRALSLFNIVITTNYDNLFERAATASGDPRATITGEIAARLPKSALIKLHGSVSDPPSLAMSEYDIFHLTATRAKLWAACRSLMAKLTPVFIGTSLQDPSVIRLLQEAGSSRPGWFVAPSIDAASRARLEAWNIVCIDTTAEAFLEALHLQLKGSAG